MTTCVYETDVLFSESTLSYLLEAGPEVKQSALSKMITEVKELLEKLKRFIQETVFRKRVKAVEDAVKKNPELGEKKVKVVDIDNQLKVEEEFVKDLKKAKTPADVEKAKAKRKKALKIVAAAAVTITIAAGLLHIKNTRSRAKSLCDEYQKIVDLAEDNQKVPLLTDSRKAPLRLTDSRYQKVPLLTDGRDKRAKSLRDEYQKLLDLASDNANQVDAAHSQYYKKINKVSKSVRDKIRHEVSDRNDMQASKRKHKLLNLKVTSQDAITILDDDYFGRLFDLRKSYNPADVEKISQSKELYEEQLKIVREITKELNTSMTETMKSMSDITEKFINAVQEI